jgi:hypothetical protein
MGNGLHTYYTTSAINILYEGAYLLSQDLVSIHTERVTARHASCLNGILYKHAS